MERITEKMLKKRVEYLNKLVGIDNPKYSTVGAYCLDYAYGGVQLQQWMNELGGIHDILRCGYCSKRELYKLMNAYINGRQDERAQV